MLLGACILFRSDGFKMVLDVMGSSLYCYLWHWSIIKLLSVTSFLIYSVVQGFVNPHGFAGKGSRGKGRGRGFETLTKPLPTTRVWGYPRFFGRVSVSLSPAWCMSNRHLEKRWPIPAELPKETRRPNTLSNILPCWHARWCALVRGPSWTLYEIRTSKQRRFFRTS